MQTSDTTKAQVCWRCRKCGYTTSLEQDICSNPSCRADLSIYGEPFTPRVQQEPVKEEKQQDSPHYDNKRQSTSNLWDENFEGKEPDDNTKVKYEKPQKLSRKEKKALKKQQAQAHAQESAVVQRGYQGSKVKAFFVSVLIAVVSLAAGVATSVLVTFIESEYYYVSCWLRTFLPFAVLVLLSVLFIFLAARGKGGRKFLCTSLAFWLAPAAIYCWMAFFFSFDGSDDYEMLLAYLALLTSAEPILLGSTFAGAKGLRRVSSFLRWLSIILLVVSGSLALILTLNSYFGFL